MEKALAAGRQLVNNFAFKEPYDDGIDCQIDKAGYELYGLTEEEGGIVEGRNPVGVPGL